MFALQLMCERINKMHGRRHTTCACSIHSFSYLLWRRKREHVYTCNEILSIPLIMLTFSIWFDWSFQGVGWKNRQHWDLGAVVAALFHTFTCDTLSKSLLGLHYIQPFALEMFEWRIPEWLKSIWLCSNIKLHFHLLHLPFWCTVNILIWRSFRKTIFIADKNRSFCEHQMC